MNKYFQKKLNEYIVYNTFKRINKADVIKDGKCIHIVSILMKYFELKNIDTKGHLGIIFNNSNNDNIPHNWISYNGKKCDITGSKQKEGFKSDIIILDKQITKKYNTTKIKIFDKEIFEKLFNSSVSDIKNKYNELDSVKRVQMDMCFNAIETHDSSFENSIIDRFIEQQDDEFKLFIKNMNKSTNINQLICFIKNL